MTEAYDEGYQAYIEDAEEFANPYNHTDGHDMHPDEYFEWGSGWRDAYLQFNRTG